MQAALEKYHYIISGIISIAFLVIIQTFTSPQPVFRYMIPAFAGYLIVVTSYNYAISRLDNRALWVIIRPLLFILGWFGLFFIIPNSFWRSVFLLISVPVIYVVERMIGKPGQQLLFNETLLSSFSGLMTITALSHYFLVPSTIYLALVFIFSATLIRASYDLTPQPPRHKWVYALVIAMVMTQFFWALSFLPLHYSALGLLLFIIFTCVWTITYNFLYNQLTKQKIQFNLAMAGLFIVIILSVTPWQIIQ